MGDFYSNIYKQTKPKFDPYTTLGGDATYGGGKYHADGKTFNSYEELIKYQQERTRVGERGRALSDALAQYDEAANKYRDQQLKSYQTSTEYAGARAMGGLAQSTGQFAMRRGLGDEFTAALNAEQQGQLRQQLTSANLDFESKLNQLMNAERLGFIANEFTFFNELQRMDYAQELSKDMARFNAELASDLSFQSVFGDLLETAGTVGFLMA